MIPLFLLLYSPVAYFSMVLVFSELRSADVDAYAHALFSRLPSGFYMNCIQGSVWVRQDHAFVILFRPFLSKTSV